MNGFNGLARTMEKNLNNEITRKINYKLNKMKFENCKLIYMVWNLRRPPEYIAMHFISYDNEQTQ